MLSIHSVDRLSHHFDCSSCLAESPCITCVSMRSDVTAGKNLGFTDMSVRERRNAATSIKHDIKE
jgi:hypothetical protein